MVVSESGEVVVRGARIAYESRRVDGSADPHLIWGHGLSMTRTSDADTRLIDWEQVPARVVRYDARGHGASESTPDLDGYSWAELARDQLALADALGIRRYVAAGASMGCGTALHAGVIAPERILGLVLVIPPTAWESRAAQAAEWKASADLIEKMDIEALIEARAALELPDPYKPDAARRLQQRADATRQWDPARLALVMRGAATADFPSRDQIAAIRLPALILAWTGDPVHPRTTADQLSALMPHARLHVASMPADLAKWTDLVADFVARLAEGATPG